jgi:nucleoside-diphosphate-sugar epimerase
MAYMLLTGATGLLGGYLLRDALRQDLPVAVVVRRTVAQSARRRIDAVLAPFETERALPRPVVLEGDLSQRGLGLADDDRQWLGEHCTSVLHSAASISFYREDRSGEPYRTNVDGTRHLLDLCRAEGIEEFHHVSTAYVCGHRSGRILESELEVGQEHGNDYELSKVAAEKLVRAAGFEVRPTIYRPSIIVGDSETGYTTTYHGYYTPLQVAWWLAKAGLLQNRVQDWFLAQLGLTGSERKNIVPVDWVSRIILDIVRNKPAHGRTYHLTCDDPPTASDLALSIGDALERHIAASPPVVEAPSTDALQFADFRKHMDVYRAYFRDHPEFDTANLRQAAPDAPCPRVDRAFLALTGQYALDHNFGWPRKQPPAAPIDLETGAGFQPARAGCKSAPLGVLEITGVGGGAWTFELASARPVQRGRCDSPAAAIRLRGDTLSAVVAGKRSVDEALRAGRILLAASPELCEAGVELLQAIVAQLKAPPKMNGAHRADPARSLLAQGEKSK